MVDDVLQKVSNEESKGENKESTITPDDFEFLKNQNWVSEDGNPEKGDYELRSNPIMVKTLKKSFEELSYEDKNFIQVWTKKLKQEEDIFSSQSQTLQLIATRQEDSASELVSEIIQRNNVFDAIKQDQISEIYYYEDGIRKPNGQTHIKEICRKIYGEAYTTQRANKVIAKIEADNYIDAEEFFKKEQENLYEIPCKNGILDLKTRKLSPFTHKKYFFNKLNVIYNPSAKCPKIEGFLSEILKNPEDQKVAFELIGSCLFKKYFLQIAVMLIGDGENGKSVFESLIKYFLDVRNCSSVPLNQLTPDSFSCSELFGKLANLAGDISNNDLKETGRFKELCSGADLIGAKRKFQRDLFFVNYAKLIFSCNELPRVYDFSHGFWRRWLILEFPYKFLKKSEFDLIEDKTNIKIADTEIIDKLRTTEELSGLLNKSLDGLNRLLKNNQFSYTKSTAEVKDFWVRKSDSFTAFCFDHIEENPGEFETKKKIRKEFNNYCRFHKVKGASDKNIKVVLENLYGVIESKRNTGNDFDRAYCWDGIKFILKKEGVQGVQGFSTLGVNGSMPIGSKTIDTMDINNISENNKETNIKKSFKCLKNTSFMILIDKKPKEIKLELGKTYNKDILGDDSEKSLQILEMDDNIEVIE